MTTSTAPHSAGNADHGHNDPNQVRGGWDSVMTSTAPATIVRRSVRAVLIDDDQRLLLIKRTKPGHAPYWTTPGGGIEEQDPTREAALARELLEELGATAVIGPQIFVASSSTDGGIAVQHFHLARLVTLDDAMASGEEHTDPSRGGYDLERIGIDQLASLDLGPESLREFVVANAAALLADLPAAIV